jgi:hypothetical protein
VICVLRVQHGPISMLPTSVCLVTSTCCNFHNK